MFLRELEQHAEFQEFGGLFPRMQGRRPAQQRQTASSVSFPNGRVTYFYRVMLIIIF